MDCGQSNLKFPYWPLLGDLSQPPQQSPPPFALVKATLPPPRPPPGPPQAALSEGASISSAMPPSPPVRAVPPPSSSPSPDSRPSTPPPKRPDVKLLADEDVNAARRAWEKAMYEWMVVHGRACSPAEKCGPCDRTGAQCVREPSMKKCALCLRGHDVCEMWDETVKNNRRRRIRVNPVTRKKVFFHCAWWKVLIGRLRWMGENRIQH